MKMIERIKIVFLFFVLNRIATIKKRETGMTAMK